MSLFISQLPCSHTAYIIAFHDIHLNFQRPGIFDPNLIEGITILYLGIILTGILIPDRLYISVGKELLYKMCIRDRPMGNPL